jgi:hypothetical protein
MTHRDDSLPACAPPVQTSRSAQGYWDRYEPVYGERPEGYDGTCLRPLGRCEMGGCCDLCWHNPEHPRFQASAD